MGSNKLRANPQGPGAMASRCCACIACDAMPHDARPHKGAVSARRKSIVSHLVCFYRPLRSQLWLSSVAHSTTLYTNGSYSLCLSKSSRHRARLARHGLPSWSAFSWPLVVFFLAMSESSKSSDCGTQLTVNSTGTIGGILAMPYWLKTFSTGYRDPVTGDPAVTASQSSMIVSLLSAGTFFGALTAAPTGDFFGRRIGLMVSTLVFTFGVILQTAASRIPLFVAGRFFAGYGVGMISALIPLYQSETVRTPID